MSILRQCLYHACSVSQFEHRTRSHTSSRMLRITWQLNQIDIERGVRNALNRPFVISHGRTNKQTNIAFDVIWILPQHMIILHNYYKYLEVSWNCVETYVCTFPRARRLFWNTQQFRKSNCSRDVWTYMFHQSRFFVCAVTHEKVQLYLPILRLRLHQACSVSKFEHRTRSHTSSRMLRIAWQLNKHWARSPKCPDGYKQTSNIALYLLFFINTSSPGLCGILMGWFTSKIVKHYHANAIYRIRVSQ